MSRRQILFLLFTLVGGFQFVKSADEVRTSNAWKTGFAAILIGGKDKRNRLTDSVELFGDCGDPVSKYPQTVESSAATTLGDDVYVCGGITNQRKPIANCYKRESTGGWTAVPSMMVTRNLFTLTAVGPKLVAIGGQTADTKLLSSIEILNPSEGGWREQSFTTQKPRVFHCAVATSASRIAVLGGFNNTINLLIDVNRGKVYNFVAFPKVLGVLSCAYRYGQILVVAGTLFTTKPSDVYSLHLRRGTLSKKWDHLGTLNKGRHGHTVGLLHDVWAVFGGSGFHRAVINSMEEFRDDKWVEITMEPRSFHSMAIIECKQFRGGQETTTMKTTMRTTMSTTMRTTMMTTMTTTTPLSPRPTITTTTAPKIVFPSGIMLLGGEDENRQLLNTAQNYGDCMTKNLPKKVKNLAATVVDNVVYICGGETERGEILDLCYRRENDGSWTEIARMTTPRHKHTITPQGGRRNPKLVALGGNNGRGTLNTVEELSLQGGNSKWEVNSRLTLKGGKENHCSFEVSAGELLLYGGDRSNTFLKVNTRVDYVKEISFREDLGSVACCLINNGAYVVSGADNREGTSKLIHYDFIQDVNTALQTMITPRYGHTAVMLKGVLTVFGGLNRNGESAQTYEEFRDVAGTWTSKRFYPPRAFHAAAEIICKK